MNTRDVLFFLGLGLLFSHELDAMTHYEWRILPLLGRLDDEIAASLFVALHVPLFAAVTALIASERRRIRRASRLGVALFLILHAALHSWLSDASDYQFEGWLSALLIYGGGLAGAAYLALTLMASRRPRTSPSS